MQKGSDMNAYTFDFKIKGKRKSYKAWLNIAFGSSEKAVIDDVSLRKLLE